MLTIAPTPVLFSPVGAYWGLLGLFSSGCSITKEAKKKQIPKGNPHRNDRLVFTPLIRILLEYRLRSMSRSLHVLLCDPGNWFVYAMEDGLMLFCFSAYQILFHLYGSCFVSISEVTEVRAFLGNGWGIDREA